MSSWRLGLSFVDEISLDPQGDFWRVRQNVAEPVDGRPSRAVCLLCGADLAPTADEMGRACPAHGPQLRYETVAPCGTSYPADDEEATRYDRRGRPANPEALSMLRAGRPLRLIAYRTGVKTSRLKRWQEEITGGQR